MTSLLYLTMWRTLFGEGTGRAGRGRRKWRIRSGRKMGKFGHGYAVVEMLVNVVAAMDGLILV